MGFSPCSVLDRRILEDLELRFLFFLTTEAFIFRQFEVGWINGIRLVLG